MVAQPDGEWHLPPPDLTLSSEALHIWRASLDQPAERVRELAQTLSAAEVARAERFYFERDRRRFIVGRGVLRAIFSRYLGLAPDQLQFVCGARGKPYLAAGSGRYPPRFNLAHSYELALYVLAPNQEVGIDLEYLRPLPDMELIAKRFFSARENSAFRAIPAELKTEAFFTCWTRKEAYIKARGDGLCLPLDSFAVSLAPGEPAELLHSTPPESSQWSLLEVVPGDGYVGAVAIRGTNWQLSCWEWLT